VSAGNGSRPRAIYDPWENGGQPVEESIGWVDDLADEGARPPARNWLGVVDEGRPLPNDPGSPLGGSEALRERGAVSIVTAREYADTEEPGGDPIIGEPGDVVIARGSIVMTYGPPGAGKSTWKRDAQKKLAAGEDVAGMPVERAIVAAELEAESPGALDRGKWRRKLGDDPGDGILVVENPRHGFRFTDLDVAHALRERGVDLFVVGPLSGLGVEGNGTLPEVRDVIADVYCFQEAAGWPAIDLVHHSSNSGEVYGAWESAVDTLIRVRSPRHGHTELWIEKARHSTRWHRARIDLEWTEGEGFAVAKGPPVTDAEEVADLAYAWLREHPHLKLSEVAAAIDRHEQEIRKALEAAPSRFRFITGDEAKALGKDSRGHYYEAVDDAR
jgi:hypothetical protein